MAVDSDMDELDASINLNLVVGSSNDLGGHFDRDELRESLAKSGLDFSSMLCDQGSTSSINSLSSAASSAQWSLASAQVDSDMPTYSHDFYKIRAAFRIHVIANFDVYSG